MIKPPGNRFHKLIDYKKSMLTLLCMVFILSIHVQVAASTIKLTDSSRSFVASEQSDYFEDPTGNITLEDVIKIYQSEKFTPTGSTQPNFGFTTSTYWFHLTILNSSTERQWLLENSYAPLDTLTAHIIHSNDTVTRITGGDTVKFHTRDIKHRNTVFKIDLPINEITEIYISVSTKGSLQLPLTLWVPEEFSKVDHENQMAFGFYYGIILVMILYNMFLLLSLRDINYLYYIFYISSYALFQASLNGLGYEYLWPNYPWWNSISIVFFMSLAMAGGLIFSKTFLHFNTNLPRINIISKIFITTFLCLTAGSLFFNYQTMIRTATFITFLACPMIFISSLICFLNKFKPARFILLAFSFLIIGIIIYVLKTVGILPRVFITEYGLQIGSALEVMFLSLALGDKYNSIRQKEFLTAQESQREMEEIIKLKGKQYTTEQIVAEEKDRNKAKSQFFASMSHEFRSPLQAIIGYTELAASIDTTEADKISYVEVISQNANHMLQLINDTLDLSKLEAQKMDIEKTPMDVIKLCQEIHNTVWVLADKKSLFFEMEYQWPLPEFISSDPIRLKQTIINLCSNAIKFTHCGGVTFRVYCEAETELIYFAIVDTGIGLQKKQIDTLFSAFTQADSSTSKNFGGTGLGLHLSKQITNRLGGDITIQSAHGRGSTFTASVNTGNLSKTTWIDHIESKEAITPHKSTADQKPSITEKIQKDDINSFRILLADDNEVNQKLIGFHIKKMGIDVISAYDGGEAIAAAIRDNIDAIFMDMDMPSMDGLSAVRYLRSKGYKIPIYALTGNTSSEAIQECEDSGCDGHLTKPINTEQLRTLIRGFQGISGDEENHPPS